MYQLQMILTNRIFIFMLFIINLFGTIYGYIWYKYQLVMTPTYFIPFVPDSPTASLFFTIFLGFYLFGKNIPYIEALALTTLFKYGIWAVVMNILTLIIDGTLRWEGYMLIASHGAMAIQGIIYAPYYKIKLRHLVLAGIVIFHDIIIDYVFGMMPIYGSLTDFMPQIGYFTFWLSVITMVVAYRLTIYRRQKHNHI